MKEITVKDIQNSIINLPNRPPAMLANQLATIYGVETRQINRAVSRNPQRFPEDFCFRATESEAKNLVSQNGTPLSLFGGHLPWMFTRFGANMLSSVLKSPIAAQRAIQIMRAFSILEETYQQPPINDTQPTAYELPDTSSGVPAHCMVIPMKEYIEMQRAEINYLKNMLPSMQPKKRRQNIPLTAENRAEIIELKKQGHSQAEIARMTGRSSATVSFLCNAAKEA